RVVTNFDRINLNGQEAFIPAWKRETFLIINEKGERIERSVVYEFVCPNTGLAGSIELPSLIDSGTENDGLWVRSGIDDRKKEYRKDSTGVSRLALITTSYAYVSGYNNEKPILMNETETFRFVKELDGKNRLVSELVSYEFYGGDNERLLLGRKIAYSEWDKDAGAVKLVEVVDDYVDFSSGSTNYYSYLDEFGELKISLPFNISFDEWDPETNSFKKVDLMSDFTGAGYKGFLAQDRKETFGLYEGGYRTGVDARHINLASPEHYTLQRMRDYRNSKGVKIGYNTELYNDGRNLASSAYTATTIFKRDGDGFLIGEATLTTLPGRGFKFENILSYDRDEFGRVQGMTRLTTAGDDISKQPNSYLVEKVHFYRDPASHLKRGEIIEQWKGDRWYKFTEEAPDNIIVNITMDVRKIIDPVTGEERIVKVQRTVDYKRQLQWQISKELWDEMVDRALGDLEGRIQLVEPGYEKQGYIYTESLDWRETTTIFTTDNRILSEEVTAFDVAHGKNTFKKDFAYELSEQQKAKGMSLDMYLGRPTGWMQSGKGDDICITFKLDANGYTDLRVDLYYDSISGNIIEQDGIGGRGVSQEENWVTYQKVYDDGRIEGEGLDEFLRQNGYDKQFGPGALPETRTIAPDSSLRAEGEAISGPTEHQVKVKQDVFKGNLGDMLDQKNLTYDALNRITGGTFTSWNNKENKYETTTKTNMHYYPNGYLASFTEYSKNKDGKTVTTNIWGIQYDYYGQETSRQISGQTENKGKTIYFKGTITTTNTYDPITGLIKDKTTHENIKYEQKKSGWGLFAFLGAIVMAVGMAIAGVFTMGVTWLLMLKILALGMAFGAVIGIAVAGIMKAFGWNGYTISTLSDKITKFTYSFSKAGRTDIEKVLKDEQRAIWNFWRVAEMIVITGVSAVIGFITAPLGPLSAILATFAAAFTQWMMDDFKGSLLDYFGAKDFAMAVAFWAIGQAFGKALKTINDALKGVASAVSKAIDTVSKAAPGLFTGLTVSLIYAFIKWIVTGKFEFDRVIAILIASGIAIDIFGKSLGNLKENLAKFWEKAKHAINDAKKFLFGKGKGIDVSPLTQTAVNRETPRLGGAARVTNTLKKFFFKTAMPGAGASTVQAAERTGSIMGQLKTNFLQIFSNNGILYMLRRILLSVMSQIASSKIQEGIKARRLEKQGLLTDEDKTITPWAILLGLLSFDTIKVAIKETRADGSVDGTYKEMLDVVKAAARIITHLVFAGISDRNQRMEKEDNGYKRKTGQEKAWVTFARNFILTIIDEVSRNANIENAVKYDAYTRTSDANIIDSTNGWKMTSDRKGFTFEKKDSADRTLQILKYDRQARFIQHDKFNESGINIKTERVMELNDFLGRGTGLTITNEETVKDSVRQIAGNMPNLKRIHINAEMAQKTNEWKIESFSFFDSKDMPIGSEILTSLELRRFGRIELSELYSILSEQGIDRNSLVRFLNVTLKDGDRNNSDSPKVLMNKKAFYVTVTYYRDSQDQSKNKTFITVQDLNGREIVKITKNNDGTYNFKGDVLHDLSSIGNLKIGDAIKGTATAEVSEGRLTIREAYNISGEDKAPILIHEIEWKKDNTRQERYIALIGTEEIVLRDKDVFDENIRALLPARGIKEPGFEYEFIRDGQGIKSVKVKASYTSEARKEIRYERMSDGTGFTVSESFMIGNIEVKRNDFYNYVRREQREKAKLEKIEQGIGTAIFTVTRPVIQPRPGREEQIPSNIPQKLTEEAGEEQVSQTERQMEQPAGFTRQELRHVQITQEEKQKIEDRLARFSLQDEDSLRLMPDSARGFIEEYKRAKENRAKSIKDIVNEFRESLRQRAQGEKIDISNSLSVESIMQDSANSEHKLFTYLRENGLISQNDAYVLIKDVKEGAYRELRFYDKNGRPANKAAILNIRTGEILFTDRSAIKDGKARLVYYDPGTGQRTEENISFEKDKKLGGKIGILTVTFSYFDRSNKKIRQDETRQFYNVASDWDIVLTGPGENDFVIVCSFAVKERNENIIKIIEPDSKLETVIRAQFSNPDAIISIELGDGSIIKALNDRAPLFDERGNIKNAVIFDAGQREAQRIENGRTVNALTKEKLELGDGYYVLPDSPDGSIVIKDGKIYSGNITRQDVLAARIEDGRLLANILTGIRSPKTKALLPRQGQALMVPRQIFGIGEQGSMQVTVVSAVDTKIVVKDERGRQFSITHLDNKEFSGEDFELDTQIDGSVTFKIYNAKVIQLDTAGREIPDLTKFIYYSQVLKENPKKFIIREMPPVLEPNKVDLFSLPAILNSPGLDISKIKKPWQNPPKLSTTYIYDKGRIVQVNYILTFEDNSYKSFSQRYEYDNLGLRLVRITGNLIISQGDEFIIITARPVSATLKDGGLDLTSLSSNVPLISYSTAEHSLTAIIVNDSIDITDGEVSAEVRPIAGLSSGIWSSISGNIAAINQAPHNLKKFSLDNVKSIAILKNKDNKITGYRL
ncbi:MAG: MFS transporter, partial [Candidatus Desantisbacteria bacterium]